MSNDMVDQQRYESDQIEDIRSLYEAIISSPDYEHYAEYRSDVDRRFESLIPGIIESLRPEADSLHAAHTRYQSLRKILTIPHGFYLLISLIVLVATGVLLIASLFNNNVMSQISPFDNFGTTLLAVALFLAAINSLLMWVRRRGQVASVQLELAVAKKEAGQKTSALVQEAFTRSINEVLGPEGNLPFRALAPRLVELSTSEVVPSQSYRALREFIAGHASSAVGIAGPRGSGKSALLRGLQHDATLQPLVATLAAPVKYESTDFVRRLYLNVAEKVDSENGFKARELTERRLRSQGLLRWMIGAGSILLGAVVVTLDISPPPIEVGLSRPPTAAMLVGLGLLGFGVVILMASPYVSPFYALLRSFRPSAESNTSIKIATRAIQKLTYDTETSSKSKGGTKLLGGRFSWELEDGITRRDRGQSHPDLVNGLRELLRAFANDNPSRPVIIMVDELDKLSSTEDLIEMVNNLKDLFHIEGVHFVVTVSTDALRSFEQRGLPARDAFHSSFDTIFPVQPLTLDESLRVLSSRSEGFPPAVGAFCHAWTGGLPRDLLRTARRCVEVQRSYGGALPLDTFVRAVVTEDLRTVIEGRLRGPDVSIADGAALAILLRRVSELEMTAKPRQTGLPKRLPTARLSIGQLVRLVRGPARLSDDEQVSTEVEVITSVLAIAERLMEEASGSSSEKSNGWYETEEGRSFFESAAKAMASRAEPQELRRGAFEAALTKSSVR